MQPYPLEDWCHLHSHIYHGALCNERQMTACDKSLMFIITPVILCHPLGSGRGVKRWMTNVSEAPEGSRDPDLRYPTYASNALPRAWPFTEAFFSQPAPNATSRSHIFLPPNILLCAVMSLLFHVCIHAAMCPIRCLSQIVSPTLFSLCHCIILPSLYFLLLFIVVSLWPPQALLFISLTFNCRMRTCSKRSNLTLFWCEEKIAYSVVPVFPIPLLF